MNKHTSLRSVWVVLIVLLFTLWASSSAATPLSLNATLAPVSTGPYAAGDTVVVVVSTSDSVSFNSLDAQVTWDPDLLVPLNVAPGSPGHFLSISYQSSGLFPSTFVAGSLDAAPDPSIPKDPPFYVVIHQDPNLDPAVLVDGPGELFRLAFQVKTGVALPASTSIGFTALDQAGGTYGGNGLALTQLFDQQGNYLAFDIDGNPIPVIYAATPQGLAIALQQQQAPEPASLSLALAALGLVVGFSRKTPLPKNR